MKIIGITDIHGNISALSKIESEVKSADLVLVAGDFTTFGGAEDAEKILEKLLILNSKIFAVSGNCDNRDIDSYLEKKGCLIHKKTVELQLPGENKNLTVLGFGGSLAGPKPTPNTTDENSYTDFFDKQNSKIDIFVVHQPPYGTVADIVMNSTHVGSKAVKAFIEKAQPALCLTGHIHESRGAEYYGKTLLVNPGSFNDGNYAIITLNKAGKFEVQLKKA